MEDPERNQGPNMKEIFERYGLLKPSPALPPLGSTLEAAERKSLQPFQFMTLSTGKTQFQQKRYRRRPADLKKLSESVLPSRAIRLIRNSISSLDYGIQPKSFIKDRKDLKVTKATDTVRSVLDNPNARDDDLLSFIGQIIEDLLIFDAGAWEYVEKPLGVMGNDILGLEVVTGDSIAQNPAWSGDPSMPRWAQDTGIGTANVTFLDSELEYLSLRKRSWTPFGISPLETAVDIMDAWLQVGAFQRTVASESYPSVIMWMGSQITEPQIQDWRRLWENELKGRGTPGFLGGWEGEPKAIQLKSKDDAGLYLKYQEMLVRTLAYAFDLKPQDLGLERDLNRSTAEVSQDQSVRESAYPFAKLIAAKMNQRVLPRIARIVNDPTILELEFFWINIDPSDDSVQSQIFERYGRINVMMIDEIRSELNLEPLPGGLGQMTPGQFEEYFKINPEPLVQPANALTQP